MFWSVFFLALCLLPTVILSLLLSHFRPSWSARKTILISASPGPAVLLLLSVLVLLMFSTIPDEHCSTEGCGANIAAAGFMLLFAALMFLVGMVIARRILIVIRKRKKKAEASNLDETFR